jgi:mannose-6-phosphate isomerase
VRRGAVVFVPAGTIHALGAGVVLAEVQQHSDITYRIYDWGRRTPEGELRELHLQKAFGIAAPEAVGCPLMNLCDIEPSAMLTPVLDCEKFHFDLLTLGAGDALASSTGNGDDRSFHLLITWEGDLEVLSPREDAFEVGPVQFVLLPAALGDYELRSHSGARALLVRVGARP